MYKRQIDACLLRQKLSELWGIEYTPKVNVSLYTKNNVDYLRVSDNGVGLSLIHIFRLIKCWEKSVDIAKNFYLERDDLKLLKLLRKNYLDEIKIVYIDIASVKTLYIRLTLLRAQMSIFPIVCNVMRRLKMCIRDSKIMFTAKTGGEWISRGGHLKQVFQFNV